MRLLCVVPRVLVRRYIKFGIAALKHQNNGRLPDTRRPGDIAATVLAYGLHYDSNHDASINDVNIGEAGSDNEPEPAADTSATDAQILQYHEALLRKSFAVVWTCWTTYLRTFSKPAAWRDAFPGRLPPRNGVVPAEDAAAVTAAATANAAAAAAAALVDPLLRWRRLLRRLLRRLRRPLTRRRMLRTSIHSVISCGLCRCRSSTETPPKAASTATFR